MGHRTPILAPRPRCGVRGGVLKPGSMPGDSGGQDRPEVPMAESLRGTSHRNPTPRVPRPCGRAEQRPTCAACCAPISRTTTRPGLTCPSARTPRSPDRWSVPTGAASSRRPWSAASIIGTPAWQHSLRPAAAAAMLTSMATGFPPDQRLPPSCQPGVRAHGPWQHSARDQCPRRVNGDRPDRQPPIVPPPGAAGMDKPKGQGVARLRTSRGLDQPLVTTLRHLIRTAHRSHSPRRSRCPRSKRPSKTPWRMAALDARSCATPLRRDVPAAPTDTPRPAAGVAALRVVARSSGGGSSSRPPRHPR